MVLDLTPGARLVLYRKEWVVERLEPHLGFVILVAVADGDRAQVALGALCHHPDVHQSSHTSALRAAARGRQEPTEQDLTVEQRRMLALRFAHLQEVETGYRSGDPAHARPGEPAPQYDPDTTTLTSRRRAKVAELAALDPDHATLVGLAHVGYRTLIRWDVRRRRYGVIGCADDRWLRPVAGHGCITERTREAIFAVHSECLHRSRISMKSRERLIHQYVRETFGEQARAEIPHYETLRVVWREWFGKGGGRQRNIRGAALAISGEHVVIHRPGQIVALDSTAVPVKIRERVFGDPATVYLTLAMDVYTRSIVGFRLSLVSDKSIDAAMLLRDITMPMPMRPGWGEDMVWPYAGIPAALIAEFAGHPVAGLPFFAPETVTTDNGSVYRNHHLVEVQRVLGCNILPSRILRPTDKQAVERAFGTIRALLFEVMLGYTGVDVADRGADPEGDAVLTIDALEHKIATWVVRIWQNRRLGEHAPSWDPCGDHSPNTLFAASMAQGGFAMQIPSPDLYYQLLPSHNVTIDPRRGVRIRRLWYDGDALENYRHQIPSRGGKYKRRWNIRRDPRDARTVFFQDPATHLWEPLRWTGLPPQDEIPSFTDARVEEMLAQARDRGLTPRSDRDLLPILLDLLGADMPVASWPSMPKPKRTDLARDYTQGQSAAADRATAAPVHDLPLDAPPALAAAVQAEPLWPVRRHVLDAAVDTDRRTRRVQATENTVVSPGRLGDSYRRGNPFSLPDERDRDESDTSGRQEVP